TPPPEVESSALVLDFLDEPRARVHDDARFRLLVKKAFSHRRKTLWNSLKSYGDARAALEKAGIDPQRRAETLSVEEFAAIERELSSTIRPCIEWLASTTSAGSKKRPLPAPSCTGLPPQRTRPPLARASSICWASFSGAPGWAIGPIEVAGSSGSPRRYLRT